MERALTSSILCAFVLCLATTHCGRGRIYDGTPRDQDTPCGGRTCTTPVDDALNAYVGDRLTEITYANDTELCRRLYVDMMGRLPTPEDYAARCQGKQLEDIMNDLFAQPDYVLARQKLWADRLGYNDARTWYRNILEMDALVGQLYKGEITFDAFIDKAAIHPAVLTAADQWEAAIVERAVNPTIDARTLATSAPDAYFATVFEKLVLRSPTLDELLELPNLYRLYEVDPVAVDVDLPGFTARRLRVQPCNCAGAKRVNCQTTNPPIDMSLPLRFPAVADCAAEPGNAFYVEDIRAEELASIAVVGGQVVRSRPDFYSNHVKETLQRLLGYDVGQWLPAEVYSDLMTKLTDAFKADSSPKNLEAAIFRSVLYRQAQTPVAPAKDKDGKDSPIFAGPLKRLGSDAYLASVATMTGHDFGVCDYRLQTRRYSKNVGGIFVTAYAPPSPVHSYPVLDMTTSEPDLTGRQRAHLIGACPDRVTQLPETDSSPFFQIGLDILAREACVDDTAKTAILPAGYTNSIADADLERVVDHQFGRMFLEPPSAAVRAAAVAGVKTCLQTNGQCTADNAARSLCVALTKSARFATY